MKKVVFIGSRLNVLKYLLDDTGVDLVKVYILVGSLLEKNINIIPSNNKNLITVFTMQDKSRVLDEISHLNFDMLISNGCPYILPVNTMKKNGQLYINIHPTLLPDLKGRTPLNGVFLTHRKAIGATMHYIDEGIDTGNIISQKQVELTDDIDQGLVYKISFDLEGDAFQEGIKILRHKNYLFEGIKQTGEGSYFNRSDQLQTIDIASDTTDDIITKVKSFNIRGQGSRIHLGGISYNIYSAEKIINPYLLKRYKDIKVSEVAFKYDNKVVIRTLDGMVKLVDYEVIG